MMTFRGDKLARLAVLPTTAWLLSDIGEHKGRQELFTRQAPQVLKALRELALVQSVESSNRIEGVIVAPDRLRPLVLGDAEPKDRSERELQGYRIALDRIHREASALAIDAHLVRGFHATIQSDSGDAGSWKQVMSADKVQIGHFKTPSSNIVCDYFVFVGSRAPESGVGCVIKSGLRPAPPRRPCGQDGGYAGDRVFLGRTGRVQVPSCAGDPGPYVYVDVAKVLGYGKTWSGGGIRCTSAITGVTCRNKSGHGFFLSRENWRAF